MLECSIAELVVFGGILLVASIFHVDARKFIIIGIILLVLSVVIMLFEQNVSLIFSIMAFFSFVLGVLLSIIRGLAGRDERRRVSIWATARAKMSDLLRKGH